MVISPERYNQCADGIRSLVSSAWVENGHGAFKDIPPVPNYEMYEKLDNFGKIVCVVAREGDSVVGYAVLFITRGDHHAKNVAVSNSVFIRPDLNRILILREMIRIAEKEAALRGANKINWMCLEQNGFGKLLEHMGYELESHIYGRPLNA